MIFEERSGLKNEEHPAINYQFFVNRIMKLILSFN